MVSRRAISVQSVLLGLCFLQAGAQEVDLATLDATANVAASDAVEGEDLPLFLQVYINGRDLGLVAEFAVHIGQNRMSATRKELGEIGLRTPPGPAAGIVYLDTLPGLTFRYDEAFQSIDMLADPGILLPKVVSAAVPEEQLEPTRETGAVLNYSVGAEFSGQNGFGLNMFSTTLDGWIYSPIGTLSSNGFYTWQEGTGGAFVRQDTNFEFLSRAHALKFVAGDVISSSMDWSRPVRMGGFQVRRDFSLRSDIITNQLLSFSGAAAVPSTVDVFIQNNRAFTTQVPAGPFKLDDLPVYVGSGEAQIVIKDAEGRTVRKNVSFFAAQDLMKPGVADYSLEVGFARQAYGIESYNYGSDPMWSGSFRYGLTNWLTMEAHGEGKSDLAMLGAGFSAVPFSLGEVTLSAGASEYQGTKAGFVRGSVRTKVMGVDVNASSLRSQDGFADLAYATGVDYLGQGGLVNDASLLEFPKALDVVSLSIPLASDNHLGVSYVNSQRTSATDQIVGVFYGTSLGDAAGSFNLSASDNMTTGDARVSVGFSFALGKRTQMRAGVATDGQGESSYGLNVSRPISDQLGDYGYGLQLEQNDAGNGLFSARGQYRTRYGRAGTELTAVDNMPVVRAEFEGAVVVSGGQLALGNSIQDSFALVDVGIPYLPVYLQNRAVTRTGPGGKALVTGLSSYRNNRVSIDVRDLPSDSMASLTAMDVVPARKAGSYVSFDAGTVPTATIIVMQANGSLMPPGTEIFLNGAAASGFVGYDGLTFLEDIRDNNQLKVAAPGGTCTATFSRPPSDPQADTMKVICQ